MIPCKSWLRPFLEPQALSQLKLLEQVVVKRYFITSSTEKAKHITCQQIEQSWLNLKLAFLPLLSINSGIRNLLYLYLHSMLFHSRNILEHIYIYIYIHILWKVLLYIQGVNKKPRACLGTFSKTVFDNNSKK